VGVFTLSRGWGSEFPYMIFSILLQELMPVAVVPYFFFTSKWVNEICRAETCNSLE
jgi:hypothetical protein